MALSDSHLIFSWAIVVCFNKFGYHFGVPNSIGREIHKIEIRVPTALVWRHICCVHVLVVRCIRQFSFQSEQGEDPAAIVAWVATAVLS